MGTRVKVVRLDNGRSVVVTITDRGPYVKGRIIDLARGPAKKLGIMKVGVCLVEIVVLD
jgi:rare lipoprotein A